MLLALSYVKIVSHFTNHQQIPVIGFNATLGYRADGQALSKAFDQIVYQRDVPSLTETGYLTPLRYTHVRSGIDFGSLELSSSTFDFDDATVRTTVGSPFFTKMVVQTYLSQCGEYTDSFLSGVSDVRVAGDRTSTLVYAHSHRQIKSLVTAFRRAGVRAAPMTGHMTRLVRGSHCNNSSTATLRFSLVV
jgi:superfamily II DNA or RNA helicase